MMTLKEEIWKYYQYLIIQTIVAIWLIVIYPINAKETILSWWIILCIIILIDKVYADRQLLLLILIWIAFILYIIT